MWMHLNINGVQVHIKLALPRIRFFYDLNQFEIEYYFLMICTIIEISESSF